MHFKLNAIFLFILFVQPSWLLANQPKLTNESEVGIILTSGNTESNTYNFQQKNVLENNKSVWQLKGRYFYGESKDQMVARSWAAGLRYGYLFTERFSGFLGYMIEGDTFAGYKNRQNIDVGTKYFFIKREMLDWFSEAGYRLMYEDRVNGSKKNFHLARLYMELNKKWQETISSQLWVEYLPNFTDTRDYMLNAEVSVSAALNNIFSIRTALLYRYDNVPAFPAPQRLDRIFTTALVARF